MSDKKVLFLKILKIELEELENEVLSLDKLYKDRLLHQEITNYVFKENHVILKNEIECAKRLLRELDFFESGRSEESMEEMVSRLVDFTKSFIKDKQYPRAMESIFNKKIEKIKKYMAL